MRVLKQLVLNTLGRMGHELIRKPIGSSHKTELSGLSFSQFLHCYFMTRDLSRFFFIQAGANDGVSNDVIHDFAVTLQLKGLIIEPQATAFEALKANYKGCANLIFDNVAISHEDGRRALYTIKRDLEFLQYVNQAASFDRQHTVNLLQTHITKQASPSIREEFKRLKLPFEDCIESETVKTYTFTSLLEKHGIFGYDLLQVDTEGFDYEVLKIAEIDKYKPALINYEHEHLSSGDRERSWDYLKRFGYQLFTHEGETTAYHLESRPIVETTSAPKPCEPSLSSI